MYELEQVQVEEVATQEGELAGDLAGVAVGWVAALDEKLYAFVWDDQVETEGAQDARTDV